MYWPKGVDAFFRVDTPDAARTQISGECNEQTNTFKLSEETEGGSICFMQGLVSKASNQSIG